MLQFAGTMMATAAMGTGIWAGADAASNAFVGFATEALERSMAKAEAAAKKPALTAEPSPSGNSLPDLPSPFSSTWSVRNGNRIHMKHLMYQRLSNMHRHQAKVEALDLACPAETTGMIGEWETIEISREVIVAVLSCALLCSAGSVLYGWMRLKKLEQLRVAREMALLRQAEQHAASSDAALGHESKEESRRSSGELDEAAMFEHPDSRRDSLDDGEARDVVGELDTPFMEGNSESVNNCGNMNLDIHPSSSQTTIRRMRSSEFRTKPTIHDIKRYFFLVPEQDTPAEEDEETLPCEEILGTSVPEDFSGFSLSSWGSRRPSRFSVG